MGKYAATTSVPIERSRSEIELILKRYGAEGFAYAWEARSAVIAFKMHGRALRFRLSMPESDSPEIRLSPGGRLRSQAQRTEIVSEFQSGGLRGLAMTIKAGGVGITLTHAHHALFVDRWWNPAVNNQAVYRLRRIGQRHHILVTHLVADHALDTRVPELLDERQRLFDATVEASAVVTEG